jgi:lipopolysaccharide/colanic/teichoic acid biosynthesis glycosyltransferase
VSLLVLSPFLAAIAIAIRLTSPGPVLYRQTRVGLGGRFFTLLRFRSMVADADAQRAALQALSEGDDVLFEIGKDPRVTKVGGFLRRASLDGLPQLINVVRGEMSLVGPAAPLPQEVARYQDDAARRLAVTPGVTGLSQVSGQSEPTWEESLRLDLRYLDNWSMVLDLSILWRTVRAAGPLPGGR